MSYKKRAYKGFSHFPPGSQLGGFLKHNIPALYHNTARKNLATLSSCLHTVYLRLLSGVSSFLLRLIQFFFSSLGFLTRLFLRKGTFRMVFYKLSVDRTFVTPTGLIRKITQYAYFKRFKWKYRMYRFNRKFEYVSRNRKNNIRWAVVNMLDHWVPILVQTIKFHPGKWPSEQTRDILMRLAWNIFWSEQYLHYIGYAKWLVMRRVYKVIGAIRSALVPPVVRAFRFLDILSFHYRNIETLHRIYRVWEPMAYGSAKQRRRVVSLVSDHYYYSYLAPTLYLLQRPRPWRSNRKVDTTMAWLEGLTVAVFRASGRLLLGLSVFLYLSSKSFLDLLGLILFPLLVWSLRIGWLLARPLVRLWFRFWYYFRTFFGHRDSLPYITAEDCINPIYLRMTQWWGSDLEPERTGTDYYRTPWSIRRFFFEFRKPTLRSSKRRRRRPPTGNLHYESDFYGFALTTEATLNVYGGEEAAEFQQSHLYVWELDSLDDEDEEQDYQNFYQDEEDSFWKDMYIFLEPMERTYYEDDWSFLLERDITDENIGFHRGEGWLLAIFPRSGWTHRVLLVPFMLTGHLLHAVFFVGFDKLLSFFLLRFWFPLLRPFDLPPEYKGVWPVHDPILPTRWLSRLLWWMELDTKNIRHKKFKLLGILVVVGWFLHLSAGVPLTHNPWYVLWWLWIGCWLVADFPTIKEIYQTPEGQIVWEFSDDKGLDQEESYRDYHDDEAFPEADFYAHAAGFYAWFHVLYIRWVLETDPQFGYILDIREGRGSYFLWNHHETYDYESLSLLYKGHDAEAGFDLAQNHLEKDLDWIVEFEGGEKDCATVWSPPLTNPTFHDPFGMVRHQSLDGQIYADYCLIVKDILETIDAIVGRASSFAYEVFDVHLIRLAHTFKSPQLCSAVGRIVDWIYHILSI